MLKNAYALTGGIATGKSTVCSLLRISGFAIIDADIIAKEKLKSSSMQIKELFGEEVFCDGIIDRTKLAQIIFSSKEKREKLNALLHPLIRDEITKLALEREKYNLPYIMDIPLFFESGEYSSKMSIVVYIPKEIQLDRLIKREKLSEDEAYRRVASQMDIEEKKKLAGWVIDNSTSLKGLQNEVEKFKDYIRSEYANIKI